MIRYSLDKSKQGVAVSEHLYGLFFEDINQAADGGLNAEMVINNSFEFEYLAYDAHNCTVPVTIRQMKDKYWDIFGAGPHYISTEGGMNANNPSYLVMCVGGIYRVENPGYAVGAWNYYGMALEKGETYDFSMWVKRLGFEGKAEVFIRGARSVLTTKAEISLSGSDGEWVKVRCSVKALKTELGRLVIIFKGNGHIGIDYVSLLPSNVWGDPNKYRNGRLSPRIVQVLKDCHPSFLRFPGGCVVEGDEQFGNQYRWRNTVGPLEERKQIANTWGYMQSYGVGFYEYFCLCEDLNMAPLPVLHCGLLCQIRVGEQRGEGYRRIMPGTQMFQEEVIDNVADLLFFAKGTADSSDKREAHWAKVRADMGHPAPFPLEFVGIGNENWGREYFENFDACLMGLRQYEYAGTQVDLIKKFNVTVVTTCGVDIRPQDSNESWKVIDKKYRDTIVDEHVYNSYQWFIDNTKRYDCYDRSSAKVFMGEYAMHTMSDGRGRLNGENNLRSAIAEAAFLTGCERNSDVVKMTCYAPLFASTANYKWTPNLIWFNPRDIMLTPNYFVQQMFAGNTGKYVLNGVGEVDEDNAGGLLIGAHATAVEVREVRVKDIASGKLLYKHNFKEGMGDWKLYPRCLGGELRNGALYIAQADAFNGYYLEGNYSDCEVEVDFRRVGGGQSFIAGVGVKDVRDTGTMDCNGFSISCQYGKNHKGYDVSFDKRVDFMRTVCEMMGKDKFVGYSPDGNTLKLAYTKKKLTAHFFKDGEWHFLFEKNVWRVNERIFQSATVDGDTVYLKVVNASGEPQKMRAELKGFGKKKTARVIALADEDEFVINEIGTNYGAKHNIQPVESETAIKDGILDYSLDKNSVTVFIIE